MEVADLKHQLVSDTTDIYFWKARLIAGITEDNPYGIGGTYCI